MGHEHQSTSSRVWAWIMAIFLVIIATAVAIFLYWNFESDKVLEVKNSPFPTRTIREHTAPNGVVILHIDYCKYKSVTGRVRASFVSTSREIFLPVSEDKQEAKCEETDLPIIVPAELPSDKYKIKFRIEYQINPLRKAINEFESREFEVEVNDDTILK